MSIYLLEHCLMQVTEPKWKKNIQRWRDCIIGGERQKDSNTCGIDNTFEMRTCGEPIAYTNEWFDLLALLFLSIWPNEISPILKPTICIWIPTSRAQTSLLFVSTIHCTNWNKLKYFELQCTLQSNFACSSHNDPDS